MMVMMMMLMMVVMMTFVTALSTLPGSLLSKRSVAPWRRKLWSWWSWLWSWLWSWCDDDNDANLDRAEEDDYDHEIMKIVMRHNTKKIVRQNWIIWWQSREMGQRGELGEKVFKIWVKIIWWQEEGWPKEQRDGFRKEYDQIYYDKKRKNWPKEQRDGRENLQRLGSPDSEPLLAPIGKKPVIIIISIVK